MGLVLLCFEQSNHAFIAHEDDYTRRRRIMRGTNILVRSLPADPVGDQRVREAVEGKGGEKGGEYEPCNLYTHLFVCVCVCRNVHTHIVPVKRGRATGALRSEERENLL